MRTPADAELVYQPSASTLGEERGPPWQKGTDLICPQRVVDPRDALASPAGFGEQAGFLLKVRSVESISSTVMRACRRFFPLRLRGKGLAKVRGGMRAGVGVVPSRAPHRFNAELVVQKFDALVDLALQLLPTERLHLVYDRVELSVRGGGGSLHVALADLIEGHQQCAQAIRHRLYS